MLIFYFPEACSASEAQEAWISCSSRTRRRAGVLVVFPLILYPSSSIKMGWAAVMVGFRSGLRQFIQQGLGIFGGAIADRLWCSVVTELPVC